MLLIRDEKRDRPTSTQRTQLELAWLQSDASVFSQLMHGVAEVCTGSWPGFPWDRRKEAWSKVSYYRSGSLREVQEKNYKRSGELHHPLPRKHPSIYIMNSQNTKTAISISVELLRSIVTPRRP